MATLARACTALALVAAIFSPVLLAGEEPREELLDRQELRRLLEVVSLSAEEAKALLGIPEALQHRILRALDGKFGEGSFSTEEWILLGALPDSLKARLHGRVQPPPAGAEALPEEKPALPGPAEEKPVVKPAPKPEPEEPPKPSLFPLQELEGALAPFGAELFRRDAGILPAPPVIPVPADYVLGPGDVLLIHYWNALVDTIFTVEVSPEGRVTIPRAGEATVGGITMEAASRLLEKRIHGIYKNASVTVTLQTLRTIRVFVVGEVRDPGLHAVGALSTVLHALFAAGGPSDRGGFRRIRVLRGEKTVSEIDLYEFLTQGKRSGDVRLFSGDTVFVPLAGPRVRVAGKVRRPAVYELKDESTLAQVLALAGGVDPGGRGTALRIERNEGGRTVLIDVTGDPGARAVRDGDRVKVFPVNPEAFERVEVSGCVMRAGRYQWREGLCVSELLELAGGPGPDAHLDYAEIRRKARPREGEGVSAGGRTYYPSWTLLRVDLGRVLKGDSEADLVLSPLDHLRILSVSDVGPRLTVEIRGAVVKPGVVEYARGMRLMDLLRREGQALAPDAHLRRAEIIRLTEKGAGYAFADGTEKTRARTVTIPVDLTRALAGEADANPLLKPFDVVKIYRAEEVRPSPRVTVLGAVQNPDTFELTSGMRVSDLVFKAGNITAEAYLPQAEIVRRVPDPSKPGSYRLDTLTLDLGKALLGEKKNDLLLDNFDRLIVRKSSDYFVEVQADGEFRFPGSYLMPKGSRLTDLVRRAGGYTDDAFLDGAFFSRKNLQAIQQKAKERFVTDQKAKLIDLEAQAEASSGDAAAAARIRESIRTRRRLLAELESIQAVGRLAIRLSRDEKFEASPHNLVLRDGDALRMTETPVSVTVQGDVFAPGSVLFAEGKRIEYYVNQVGGMKEDADELRIYVVKADGRAHSRAAPGAFSIRWDAENLRWVRHRLGRVVDRGDVIIVPPKQVVVKGYDLTKDIVDILYKIALSAGVLAGIAG